MSPTMTIRTAWDAECPKCKEDIKYKYCPIHGIPGGEYNNEGIQKEYFRPEFKTFQDYQLCSKCHARNPYGANFCKYCGEDITLQAADKNRHGWVDLGLSVLWSTKHMPFYYKWDGYGYDMDETEWEHMFDEDIETWVSKHTETNRVDPATIEWGEKWRTPTKEEFEELIINCKWEKCMHPISRRRALKATGPNGNSIYIFATGAARICNDSFYNNSFYHDSNLTGFHPEADHSHCIYWTSSEAKKPRSGCAFSFIGYDPTSIRDLASCSYMHVVRINGCYEKEHKEIREESKYSKEAERDRLWLNTPVEILCNGNTICKDTNKSPALKVHMMRGFLKCHGFCIRPVADKKWQGKL